MSSQEDLRPNCLTCAKKYKFINKTKKCCEKPVPQIPDVECFLCSEVSQDTLIDLDFNEYYVLDYFVFHSYCGHQFHYKCLEHVETDSCPICKQTMGWISSDERFSIKHCNNR